MAVSHTIKYRIIICSRISTSGYIHTHEIEKKGLKTMHIEYMHIHNSNIQNNPKRWKQSGIRQQINR